MKEHHLRWYQLQGQNLSLWSHGILAVNRESDEALLGKCSQLQKHKIIWLGTDPGTLLLKGNLLWASKGAGKGLSCLSLALDKDDEKHSKQQQNLHIWTISAESAVLCIGFRAGRQAASRGFLHAKHSQILWKNIPVLSFPKLLVSKQ